MWEPLLLFEEPKVLSSRLVELHCNFHLRSSTVISHGQRTRSSTTSEKMDPFYTFRKRRKMKEGGSGRGGLTKGESWKAVIRNFLFSKFWARRKWEVRCHVSLKLPQIVYAAASAQTQRCDGCSVSFLNLWYYFISNCSSDSFEKGPWVSHIFGQRRWFADRQAVRLKTTIWQISLWLDGRHADVLLTGALLVHYMDLCSLLMSQGLFTIWRDSGKNL